MSDNVVDQPGSIKSAAATVSPGVLRDLVVSFLRLGLTAFGGPAAHVAMMDEEFVRRRAWVSRTDFLDMLAASNLVPGPSSTEMAIHIGHQRAGWGGLIISGVCFIFPAMVIVMICAWAYARFGSLPQVQSIMYGVKPVVIAIVFQALLGLARRAVKSGFFGNHRPPRYRQRAGWQQRVGDFCSVRDWLPRCGSGSGNARLPLAWRRWRMADH